jgi:Zn-dependent peptidase ImmA (M78 family)
MLKSERYAQAVLTRFDIREPPVDVEGIVKQLDAQLRFVPYDDEMSGMLYRDRESRVTIIGINSSHASTRQRFSIAHEIGHLEMHKQRLMFVDKLFRVSTPRTDADWTTRQEEIEANGFAASLLMPESFIEAAMRRERQRPSPLEGDELVRDLARRFDVSAEAMGYRLANLGWLIP